MTARPILFSAPMVRALLDGTKTQTRRLIKPQPIPHDDRWSWGRKPGVVSIYRWDDRDMRSEAARIAMTDYRAGDRLWVRETYYQRGHWVAVTGKLTKGRRQKWAFQPADDTICFDPPGDFRRGRHHLDPATVAWHQRLGRFMPRRYSRLTLTLTDVRLQRLRDLSEADAQAEGIKVVPPPPGHSEHGFRSHETYPDGTPHPHAIAPNRHATTSFRELWDSLHGPGAWDADPWIVALNFDVRKGNIDVG